MSKKVDTSQRDEKLLGEQIAFAELSFTANARGTMAERDYTDGGGEDGGFVGGGRCARTVGGDWDRRLARSSNFLQLCRDDLCGKMKTLKVRLSYGRVLDDCSCECIPVVVAFFSPIWTRALAWDLSWFGYREYDLLLDGVVSL